MQFWLPATADVVHRNRRIAGLIPTRGPIVLHFSQLLLVIGSKIVYKFVHLDYPPNPAFKFNQVKKHLSSSHCIL
jgi:hypothetical protein